MTAERDWLIITAEVESDWLEAEDARLHERLAAAQRLNETLCNWGRSLEQRVAELAERGGRPRKVDHTEVVQRIAELTELGLDLPKAKTRLIAELKAAGKPITRRRIEKILETAPPPVRVKSHFRVEVAL